jgi:DNA modification methylase
MLTQGTFFAAAAAADILIHRQIIWVKPHMVLTRSGMYHWRHELCFYGWRRGNKPEWYGSKGQTSVWDDMAKESKAGRNHPTQKPVELFERPIGNHALPGEVIYEPFSGSGSQIIAAEKTDRECRAMEIDARYIDAAIIRWQSFTGQQATLNGKTFDEVRAERAAKAA